MSKSFKLNNNIYLDSDSVSYKRIKLEKYLDDLYTEIINKHDEVKDEIKNETYYKSGDVVELGNITDGGYNANGYISSGTKAFFLMIYLPKRLDNITNISFNSIKIEARGPKGYLNSTADYQEYVGKSSYTITYAIESSNSIKIRIQKSSVYTNVDNNSPAQGNGYFKLTLA